MYRTLLLTAAVILTAGAVVAQDTLSGNITANKLLTSNRCYYLRGCVTVKSGAILAIQPGTKIFGLPAILGGYTSSLIVERGARINALGTASAPIIFTSSLPPGSRARGDWGGIIIAGNAPINVTSSGEYIFAKGCTPFVAGGSNVSDNSGTLKFVQIHYTGGANAPDEQLSALTLVGVGNGTVIENIQVTHTNDDAFQFLGGTVNARNLVALNVRDDDFYTELGYRGKIQFGLSLRKDTLSHDISGSNGIESNNNYIAPDYLGTPKTRAIFSNFTFIGPKYCNPGMPLHAEYDNGALIRRNSALSLYNSIVTSWPDNGLLIKDGPTVANTALTTGDMLNYSYNSLYDNGTNFASDTWTGGCVGSMLAWANVGAPPPPPLDCKEFGNETPPGIPAFTNNGNSIKGNYCVANPDFSQPFALGNASFVYSDLSTWFTAVNYRGAFGPSDWTAGWTTWCPQYITYGCGTGFAAMAASQIIRFAPNPASNSTYAIFDAAQLGTARISIMDQISGQAIKVVNTNISVTGEQKIQLDINGLKAGTYFVNVVLKNGSTINGQLIVQ